MSSSNYNNQVFRYIGVPCAADTDAALSLITFHSASSSFDSTASSSSSLESSQAQAVSPSVCSDNSADEQRPNASTKLETGGTATRKYTKQKKDPKRDTAVSYEEMIRLMNVYGPIKYQRKNPAMKEAEREIKPESIRRRFYRYFPNFADRFVKTPEGSTYMPKAGHQEEMRYREELRKKDHDAIMAKKNARRRPQTSSTAQAGTNVVV